MNTTNTHANTTGNARANTHSIRVKSARILLAGLAAMTFALPCLHSTNAHADGLYLPELRITKVADYYDRGGKLDQTHAWVYVNNQGTAASGQCTLTYNLYLGINGYFQIGDAQVPAISPGQTKAVLISTPVSIHAPHKTLRFTVDAFNVVQEFLENNNNYDIDNPY